jgi:hypothetical protein
VAANFALQHFRDRVPPCSNCDRLAAEYCGRGTSVFPQSGGAIATINYQPCHRPRM